MMFNILGVGFDVFGVLALAFINRQRGGGWPARLLPFHPRWICALAVFGVATITLGEIVTAAWFAAGWFLWTVPAWGRYYSLGRVDRTHSSGEPSWYERLLERTGWSDHVLFTIRNTVCLLPLAPLAPWLLLLGPLQTVAYEIGWRRNPKGGTIIGEWLTGALWGAALLLL